MTANEGFFQKIRRSSTVFRQTTVNLTSSISEPRRNIGQKIVVLDIIKSYAVERDSETSEVFEDSYAGQIRPQWGNFCDKDYTQDFRSLNGVTSNYNGP